jgi:hypothetical protein
LVVHRPPSTIAPQREKAARHRDRVEALASEFGAIC